MKNAIKLIILLKAILVFWGCSAFQSAAPNETTASASFTALVWNVQALFDGEENGSEYSEYLPASGWTKEKYNARITSISQAIKQTANTNSIPDIMGFVELENSAVLEDLASGTLSEYGFFWTAFAANPGSSLGIGFLSRFPLKDVRTHSITILNDTAPRPVLEVKVEGGGMPLVFLLCHWKSKLGGDDATEAQRRASARVVQRRLREINANEQGTPVIVMGDLNENHDEFSRRLAFSALLPDDPFAASMAINSGALDDFLVLSGEKPPVASHFQYKVPAFYSPWENELEGGSYYYRGEWETIDHFLLSDSLFNRSGWVYSGCEVLNQTPFVKADGIPNTYNPKNGLGLSDHLPMLLHLRRVE